MNRTSESSKQAMGQHLFPNYLEPIYLGLNHYHLKWPCTILHLHLNNPIKVSGMLIVREKSHPTVIRCPPLHHHHLDRGIHLLHQTPRRVGRHLRTAPGIEVLPRPLHLFRNRILLTHLSVEHLLRGQVVM